MLILLCSPTITSTSSAGLPAVQWAAVSTWLSDIRAPPHLISLCDVLSVYFQRYLSILYFPDPALPLPNNGHMPRILGDLGIFTTSNLVVANNCWSSNREEKGIKYPRHNCFMSSLNLQYIQTIKYSFVLSIIIIIKHQTRAGLVTTSRDSFKI